VDDGKDEDTEHLTLWQLMEVKELMID